jgi:hypothetical protein
MAELLIGDGSQLPERIGGHPKHVQPNLPTAKNTLAVQEQSPASPAK